MGLRSKQDIHGTREHSNETVNDDKMGEMFIKIEFSIVSALHIVGETHLNLRGQSKSLRVIHGLKDFWLGKN